MRKIIIFDILKRKLMLIFVMSLESIESGCI